MDRKRITTLKGIIQEVITTQKNGNLKTIKDMDIARDTLQTVSGNDFNLFCQSFGLGPVSTTQTSESLSKKFRDMMPKQFIDNSFINVFKTSSILRIGELEMSGILVWTKYSFVLTKFGFLHYFSKDQVKITPFSTSLFKTQYL